MLSKADPVDVRAFEVKHVGPLNADSADMDLPC